MAVVAGVREMRVTMKALQGASLVSRMHASCCKLHRAPDELTVSIAIDSQSLHAEITTSKEGESDDEGHMSRALPGTPRHGLLPFRDSAIRDSPCLHDRP